MANVGLADIVVLGVTSRPVAIATRYARTGRSTGCPTVPVRVCQRGRRRWHLLCARAHNATVAIFAIVGGDLMRWLANALLCCGFRVRGVGAASAGVGTGPDDQDLSASSPFSLVVGPDTYATSTLTINPLCLEAV